MRAVIDTNVWVSALLTPTGPPARVLAAYRAARFSLIISDPLVTELASVLTRPRIAVRYSVTLERVAALLALLQRDAIQVPVHGIVRISRDPDDDAVIETAIRGEADVIVSRDDDLKYDPAVAALLAVRGIRVHTVRHFLELLDDPG